jgi:hypothetical protein
MYLIIGFALALGLVLVGILIPKDTYEIWPRRRRLKKSVGNDGDEEEPAARHEQPRRR